MATLREELEFQKDREQSKYNSAQALVVRFYDECGQHPLTSSSFWVAFAAYTAYAEQAANSGTALRRNASRFRMARLSYSLHSYSTSQ